MMILMSLILFLFGSHLVFAETYCKEGSLKLDNTTDDGYVLVCSQGKWGFVCGREQNASPWTKENVGVACQQLGYIRDGDSVNVPQLSQQKAKNILGDSIIHYRFIHCTGVERRLIDCPHGTTSGSTLNWCRRGSNNYRFGVANCASEPVQCETPGKVRIANGTALVQMCSQGQWYFIRANKYNWREPQAKVVCRQMGLNPNGAGNIVYSTVENINKILNVAFHCEGHESTLSECSASITKGGQPSTIAGVTCGDQMPSPLNVNAITVQVHGQHIITISWEYNATSVSSVTAFHVTCTGSNSVTLLTIVTPNGTSPAETLNHMVAHLPVGVTPLGVQYNCCVEAVSSYDIHSERICGEVYVNEITTTTADMDTSTSITTSDSLSIAVTTQITSSTSLVTTDTITVSSSTTTATDALSTTLSTISHQNTTRISESLSQQSIPRSSIDSNTDFVSSPKSPSIAWGAGILVGIIIGMAVVILVLLSYTLCYKKLRNSRKQRAVLTTSQMGDTTKNSVEMTGSMNKAILNPTYGSNPMTVTSNTSITKPLTDEDNNNYYSTAAIYEPVYTDAELPADVDNVYSLLNDSSCST